MLDSLFQQASPLTQQLLIKAVKDDIAKQNELRNDKFQHINIQIVGAEIIYATPDSFYLVNPQSHKRFVVKVGDWQMRVF